MVVVEGHMDVIALAAAGIEEAVAPMGTALTERQIELLWRLVETPILCFDGDAAGQRAAMRAVARALPLLRPGHSLHFVRLPAGHRPRRPAQARRARGRWTRCSPSRTACSTRCGSTNATPRPLATPEDKAGLKARLLAHVETIAAPRYPARSTAATCATGSPPSPSPSASSPRAGLARQARRQAARPRARAITAKLRRLRRRRARCTRAGGARRARRHPRRDRPPCRGPRAASPSPTRELARLIDACSMHGRTLETARLATILRASRPGSAASGLCTLRFSFLVEGADPQDGARRPGRSGGACWSKGRRSKPRWRRRRRDSNAIPKALSPSSSGCAEKAGNRGASAANGQRAAGPALDDGRRPQTDGGIMETD